MKDRIPKYAGRIKLIPVDEINGIYDMVRADEPVEEGTPINKATLLADATATKLGLTDNATVNEALNVLSKNETWVFTLEDGSTVSKAVRVE